MPRSPEEVVVRNLFLIQRFGNSINDEVRVQVMELFDQITGLIARVDPMGSALQRYRVQRARKLFAQIEELSGATFNEIQKQVRLRLASWGKQQSQTAAVHLRAIIGAGSAGKVDAIGLTINQVKAIVDTNPMEGAVMGEWFERQGERTAFQVRRQIQLGMTRGETIDDMVRRVRGTATGAPIRERGRIVGYNFSGGVFETTTREAEAIVRTAVNEVSNVAAFETYRANADITTTYEYTATLDSRTTLICASLDGQTFGYDDPAGKRPPQHWNCRSIIVPNVDWRSLGMEPPPEGTRASAGGQVAADTKYTEWLKANPGVAREVLGPTRAELFLDGRVSLRDMVRSDGRRVPLEDLQRRAA